MGIFPALYLDCARINLDSSHEICNHCGITVINKCIASILTPKSMISGVVDTPKPPAKYVVAVLPFFAFFLGSLFSSGYMIRHSNLSEFLILILSS